MAGSYIVAGARTPIGKMSGALSSFSAAELGGFAIKAALERAGVALDPVVAAWGPFKPDPVNVTVAGKRQAEAVRLMDRAGWR